jgi:hypothetical protein
MSSNKPNNRHNNEYIYKIPFIEHEYAIYKESMIRRRIVKALIVTNTIWLLFVAFIMSSKR